MYYETKTHNQADRQNTAIPSGTWGNDERIKRQAEQMKEAEQRHLGAAATAPKQGAITEAINNLDHQLNELSGVAEVLMQRLHPVLAPSGVEEAAKPYSESSVPFANVIAVATHRVRMVRGLLQDTMGRLEI